MLTYAGPASATDTAPELEQLAVMDSGKEMYPEFDPDTLHYAVRSCNDDDTLTLMVSTKAEDTQLKIDGRRQSSNKDLELEIEHLDGHSDIVISLSDGAGASRDYIMHCLGEDFPLIKTTKQSGAWEGLITLSVNISNNNMGWSYIAIVDTNDVPWFRQRVEGRTFHFRTHKDGKFPYSYFRRVGTLDNCSSLQLNDYKAVVLDANLREVRTVQIAAPLTHTDPHDFIIKPNGNYVFLAYEPARRDLSAFDDPDDNPYSTTECTEDSVIQEVTSAGVEVFRWNSWDHMAIEDCTQHRFPQDYAHVNSLQIVDGDIIASFRGCSQVLRIDGTSGAVMWRLGRSNRSDADWTAGGGQVPLTIQSDSYGEFCGQHAARITPGGNLILFDNGGHCLVDPETQTSQRTGGVFSRAVEYALDLTAETATWQRHHSLHNDFNRYARSGGHVEVLDNGNWLISWGRGHNDDDPNTPLPPDESVTEVNPQTGDEVLSVRITHGSSSGQLSTRAYPLAAEALDGFDYLCAAGNRPRNAAVCLSPSPPPSRSRRASKRSAPATAPTPTPDPLFSASTSAATIKERVLQPGQSSLVIRRHDQPGVEVEVGVGWTSRDGQTIIAIGFVRDGDLGQTYAVVRREGDGQVVRRWIAPDSHLVYAVPWAIVNTQYTFPVGVILAIPLDDQYPWPNMLTRRFDGGDDRILAYDAELGQWRHVPDPATFQALGFYWCNVTAADAGFFDRITLGPPYPASSVPARADYPVCRT